MRRTETVKAGMSLGKPNMITIMEEYDLRYPKTRTIPGNFQRLDDQNSKAQEVPLRLISRSEAMDKEGARYTSWVGFLAGETADEHTHHFGSSSMIRTRGSVFWPAVQVQVRPVPGGPAVQPTTNCLWGLPSCKGSMDGCIVRELDL